MAEDRECQGYKVIRNKRIRDVEVVLAHKPGALSPYVTWKSYAHTQFKDFAYGHYFGDKESAEKDFLHRIAEVRRDYGLAPKRHKPPDRGGEAR